MELIIKGNISNKIGDKIIKFFNKYSNLKKSPLPKSTKNGKDYLNQINSPSVKFKEKVVASYSGIDFTFYYRPIFRTIQALLQQPEVTDYFVHKEILKKKKVCYFFLIILIINKKKTSYLIIVFFRIVGVKQEYLEKFMKVIGG